MQLRGKLSHASIFSEWTNYVEIARRHRADRSIALSVEKQFYFWWQEGSIKPLLSFQVLNFSHFTNAPLYKWSIKLPLFIAFDNVPLEFLARFSSLSVDIDILFASVLVTHNFLTDFIRCTKSVLPESLIKFLITWITWIACNNGRISKKRRKKRVNKFEKGIPCCRFSRFTKIKSHSFDRDRSITQATISIPTFPQAPDGSFRSGTAS